MLFSRCRKSHKHTHTHSCKHYADYNCHKPASIFEMKAFTQLKCVPSVRRDIICGNLKFTGFWCTRVVLPSYLLYDCSKLMFVLSTYTLIFSTFHFFIILTGLQSQRWRSTSLSPPFSLLHGIHSQIYIFLN